MRNRNRGMSLVELMVAVTLALVTIVVVMQVLSVYEARKRTSTVGNDAEMSAAVGLFMLERQVRSAGAGLTLPTGFACGQGVNGFYDGVTFSNGAPLAPLAIVDGGAVAGVPRPDRLRVLHSDSAFGVAPGTVIQGMAAATSPVMVSTAVGLVEGDLMLVGSADGQKLCTLMQLSDAPDPVGSGLQLPHASGGAFPYNPASPPASFANAIRYDVGDIVVNLGRLGMRTFGVICNDGAAPAVDNSCDLAMWDTLAAPANPTLAEADSVASQVYNLQVQYGVSAVAGAVVTDWVDATGGWAAPSAVDIERIKAVRIAIVTRGNFERDPEDPTKMVSPAELVLWDAGEATELAIPLTDDERNYRYKVLRVVVPLINVIWAGV